MSLFTVKEGKKLRCGYTTGSCAAAAAKAAAMMVLTGRRVDAVSLQTPQGTVLQLIPEDISFGPQSATCAIRKDSGDDPDITDGMLVYGTVEKTPSGLSLIGGEGVGRVTQPGLACAVGDWAINPVPRRMITEALKQACQQCGYTGGLRLTLRALLGQRKRGRKHLQLEGADTLGRSPHGNGFPPRCRPGSFTGLFRQLRRRF